MELIDLARIPLPEIKTVSDRISYVPATLRPLSSDIGIIKGDSKIYVYDTGSTLPALKLLQELPDDKAFIISHFHGDHTWWLSDHKHGEHGVADDDNISTSYTRPSFEKLYVSALTSKYVAKHSPEKSFDRTGLEDDCSCDIPVNADACPEAQGTETTDTERIVNAAFLGSTVVVQSPLVIEDGVRLEILPLPCTHCKGSLALSIDDTYCFVGDATYPNKVNNVTFYNAQLLQKEIEVLEAIKADNLLLSHDSKFVRPKKAVLRQLKATYDKWDKTDSLIRL